MQGRQNNCLHCGELIEAGERTTAGVHFDCLVRMICGGANHQAGTCSCCGGDRPPDPPGLTRREAARLAASKWESLG